MRGNRFIVLAAGLAAALPAAAQNRLGDGRGLERQLEITAPTQRYNPAEAWRQELQFRDAIVTGNAPGGLSFRGDTAYRSSREFAGELGSNDLFSFRRDSLYSGLSGHGLRATDALQYQMALTTGSRAPAGIIGSPLVYQGQVASGADVRRRNELFVPGGDMPRRDPDFPVNDPYAGGGSLLGALRSPSAYVTSRSSQPMIMSTQRDLADNPLGMTASALGGIKLVPLVVPERLAMTDIGSSLASPDVRSAQRSAYDIVRERLAEAAASPEGATELPEWERRLAELRAELDAIQMPVTTLPLDREGTMEPVPAEPGEESPAGYEGLEPATIEFIRRGRIEIESFVGPLPEGVSYDAYGEHMRIGEHLMHNERYFDAEERFIRALAARSGDPTAMVARVHAQLGAGLYRSAATNLREAMMRHPELAPVRYRGGTMPSAARTATLMHELKANIGFGDGESMRQLERESALLLAYLAFQTGDTALCARSLDVLSDSRVAADAALIALLRGVWLEAPARSGEGGGSGG
ncbi:MAG: hypothetical protein KIT24_08985 [Phycisphaeraceae bacterium]|nr:hypothetical protein [Phycisphaeraceae bacterium]